jgi:hypothetical protein
MIVSVAFLVASLLLESSMATIYLSVFGSDSNDGSSPANAVATLGRALQLTPAGADIEMAAGVIPLGVVTVKSAVTVRAAGNGGGNPALFQFACSNAYDTISVMQTTLSLVGVSITNCATAISLGLSTPYYTHVLNLDNVQFIANSIDVKMGDGSTSLSAHRTTFTGSQGAVVYCAIYSNDVATVYLNASSITTSIDTSNKCSSTSYTSGSSLAISSCKFSGSGGKSFIYTDQALKLDHVTFSGPFSTASCGVTIRNVKASVSDVVFDSLSGSPALCINNGIVNVVNSQFVHNTGNQTAGAPIGAGIYMTGSTVGVSNSNFNGNQVYGDDGAGIHCEMSRLTVGSTSFSYNKAGTAAACSQFGCTIVQFNNTLSRNIQQAPGNACW